MLNKAITRKLKCGGGNNEAFITMCQAHSMPNNREITGIFIFCFGNFQFHNKNPRLAAQISELGSVTVTMVNSGLSSDRAAETQLSNKKVVRNTDIFARNEPARFVQSYWYYHY